MFKNIQISAFKTESLRDFNYDKTGSTNLPGQPVYSC